MKGRWGEAPFAALALCLAAGIAAARFLDLYSFACLTLAVAALAAVALVALRRNRPAVSLGAGLSAILLSGVLLGLAERDGYPPNDLRALRARGTLPLGELLLLDGCVLEDGLVRGPGILTTLEVRGLRRGDSWSSAKGKVQLRVAVPEDAPAGAARLEAGDRVRVWAECDLPQNFQNPGSPDRVGSLARRDIHILAHVKSPRLVETLPGDCGTIPERAFASIRRSLLARFRLLEREGDAQRAAVLSSIVLGDYTELGAEIRTDFQNAGTYHVLVVSGLHVSWIAWAMVSLLQMLRAPAGVSRLMAALGILAYTCLVGFQASLSRSLWMFGLVLIGQSLFRRAAPVNTVFACGFLLLVARPAWLLDAGFQLSFAAVLSIALMGTHLVDCYLRPLFDPIRHCGNAGRLCLQAGNWARAGRRLRIRAELAAEALADRWHASLEPLALACFRAAGALGFLLAGMILISLAVQLWLEPVLALYFNRLSWVAPAANLVVVPLSSLVLASGLAAALITSMIPWTWPAFRLAGLFCGWLLQANSWFLYIPGAWQRCPTPSGLVVASGLMMIFLWCFLRRRSLWIPCVFIGLHLASLSLPGIHLAQRVSEANSKLWAASRRVPEWRPLRLTFLDVGQGDAMVIQFPDNRVWAVDAGGLRIDPSRPEDGTTMDVGESVVSRFLWSRWTVDLDRVVLTHPHQDHAGGIPALLENFAVGKLAYGDGAGDPSGNRVADAAQRAGVRTHRMSAGETATIAGVMVRVLHPREGQRSASLNDGSVVLRLEYGRFSALLAGDIEAASETSVLAGAPELRSLLLKVAHHGSRSSTFHPLLDKVSPRWAVISAARKNPFGNPSAETLGRLLRHGARLLLTMDQGAIFFETDGIRYRLQSHVLGMLEEGSLERVP